MKIPHPIPYQGSKRKIADRILRFFPIDMAHLIEPFAGSGAVTIAAAYHRKVTSFHLNDFNGPLMELWDMIINHPDEVAKEYQDIWQKGIGNEDGHYLQIREQFNKTQKPEYLLYLLARCVKAAVRYNAGGEFNQSQDKRRKGRHPATMREDILRVSALLKGNIQLTMTDYREVLEYATPNDVVYLDPPYQGTGLNGGFRYLGEIGYGDFIDSLRGLNRRGIPYLVSYDGRTGTKTFGTPLPQELDLHHMEIDAGQSSQATLHRRTARTFESLYLSSALIERLETTHLLHSAEEYQIHLGL